MTTLHQHLSALGLIVCVRAPATVPEGPYVIVEDAPEGLDTAYRDHAEVWIRTVRVHLYSPELPAAPGEGKAEADALYERILEEVPRHVNAHPVLRLMQIERSRGCLPPDFDPDEGRWVSLAAFDLQHFRS